MKSVSTLKLPTITLVLAALITVAALGNGGQERASADPKPPVEFGCLIFGVDAEDCPNGALIVHGACEVPSMSIPQSPSSKLETYADYLDLDAIYSSGPDFDGDGLGELVSGINAPGEIKLVVSPSGKLNIQCTIDVSDYMLEDAPKKALVTEFLCGPPGEWNRRGTSRLNSSGVLKINCHDAEFGS